MCGLDGRACICCWGMVGGRQGVRRVPGGGVSLRAGMLRRNSCHGSFASIIAAGGGEIDVRGD